MLPNTIRFSLFIFISFLLVSCGTSKAIYPEIEAEKLEKIKEEVLISRLDSLHQRQPDFFTTRTQTKYQDINENQRFRTSIKMKADSAIQAIISFSQIPLVNALLTTDSIVMTDRRSQCYIQKELNYFKQLFDVEFSFANFQELLLGLPLNWDTTQEYHQIRDAYHYIISPQKKRDIRKMDSGEGKGFIIRYVLTADATALRQVIIDSPENNTTIVVSYDEHEWIENFFIPQMINVNVKTEKNDIFVELKHSKVTINDPSVIYLSIPDKYEACE